MNGVYNNINDCNLNGNMKTLIVFGDMIAAIMTIKKLQGIIKDLFIRCKN